MKISILLSAAVYQFSYRIQFEYIVNKPQRIRPFRILEMQRKYEQL